MQELKCITCSWFPDSFLGIALLSGCTCVACSHWTIGFFFNMCGHSVVENKDKEVLLVLTASHVLLGVHHHTAAWLEVDSRSCQMLHHDTGTCHCSLSYHFCFHRWCDTRDVERVKSGTTAVLWRRLSMTEHLMAHWTWLHGSFTCD